jgi:Thioredoxin domain-containing protein
MIRFVMALSLTLCSVFAQGQSAGLVKIKDIQKMMTSTDQVQVINFWATWCAPCIKELPQFEKVNRENKNVKVTLVSMDFDLDPDPAKVNRFIAKKGLKSSVVILTEQDPNSWIDKIDKSWNGSIPATLIINGKTGKRKFIEKELREGDLEKLIAEIM